MFFPCGSLWSCCHVADVGVLCTVLTGWPLHDAHHLRRGDDHRLHRMGNFRRGSAHRAHSGGARRVADESSLVNYWTARCGVAWGRNLTVASRSLFDACVPDVPRLTAHILCCSRFGQTSYRSVLSTTRSVHSVVVFVAL